MVLHKERKEKNQDTIQLLIFKIRFFIRATDLRAVYIKKKGEHFLNFVEYQNASLKNSNYTMSYKFRKENPLIY